MTDDKDVRIEPAELKQAMASDFEQLIKGLPRRSTRLVTARSSQTAS
jgi:hypothetical protein